MWAIFMGGGGLLNLKQFVNIKSNINDSLILAN
jgi:hypothetical protein